MQLYTLYLNVVTIALHNTGMHLQLNPALKLSADPYYMCSVVIHGWNTQTSLFTCPWIFRHQYR